MPSKVFISYRREDAKWQAREVFRALTQVLPRDPVFIDMDSIPPGVDFVDALEDWVARCDILLALIGPGWNKAIDPKTGRPRLENLLDFVRIEVRKALVRGIPVVPILLDGAQIPDEGELPDDLKKLVRRNAEFIELRSVDTDVERLIKKLGLAKVTQPPPSSAVEPPPMTQPRPFLKQALSILRYIYLGPK
jgi:TIR domain